MQKREAQFGLKFRRWLKANHHLVPSGAFELKQTTTTSLPFSALQEHQIDALLAAKSGKGIVHKISDDSIGVKPFDYFYLRNSFGWVVIKYPKGFVLISIDVFLLEKERSKRKSLTWDRARSIATIEELT